jgi:hypothetical protein
MTLDQLENEILALPKESQTAILSRLLARLGEDAELIQTWQTHGL